MSAIIAALSAGAAAFAKGALSAAGKDAYDALKAGVCRVASPLFVEKLEKKPDSQNLRGALADELENAGEGEGQALARLAQALVAALKESGTSAGATGVALEEIEAINIRLSQITASGTGVSLKKVKAAGDIEITGVNAGVPPGK